MGAKKIIYNGYYVERWFFNPDDVFEIPKGTVFYGDAASKLKHRFIVKYYIDDDYGSKIQIPEEDMWIVNHNGKSIFKQDDSLFLLCNVGLWFL